MASTGLPGQVGSKCCNPAFQILTAFRSPAGAPSRRLVQPCSLARRAFFLACLTNEGTGSTRSTKSNKGKRTVEVTRPMPAPQSRARKGRAGRRGVEEEEEEAWCGGGMVES